MATASTTLEQRLTIELGKLHPDFLVSLHRVIGEVYPILSMRKGRWERWSHAAIRTGSAFGMYTRIYAIGKNLGSDTYTLNTKETSCPIMSYKEMCNRVKPINRKSGNEENFAVLVNKDGSIRNEEHDK